MKIIQHFLFSVLPFITFSQVVDFPQPALPTLSDFQHVRDFTMNANQTEAYFTVQSPNEEIAVIVRIAFVNSVWTPPEMVPFTGKFRDIEPFLSPDGKRLYFSSNRPLNALDTTIKDYDIWYVERTDNPSNWSEPINLGKPINSTSNEFYPSLATNGNLYFTSDAGALLNKDDIYFSEFKKGKYQNPIPLDQNINSTGYEFNAYISPDERFLIYTAYGRKEGFGSGDLYISYRTEKGNWDKALNMGEAVNSKAMDYCPFVDLKTNTLYFTSKRSSIKPSEFKSISEFLKVANQYENGLSRLYKVPFSFK